MNDVNKYLRIAKDAVIKPGDRIEDKIMDRISHVKQEDRDKILDKKFLEFFRNNNSKPYLLEQKIRAHPGVFAFILILAMGVLGAIIYIIKMMASEDNK